MKRSNVKYFVSAISVVALTASSSCCGFLDLGSDCKGDFPAITGTWDAVISGTSGIVTVSGRTTVDFTQHGGTVSGRYGPLSVSVSDGLNTLEANGSGPVSGTIDRFPNASISLTAGSDQCTGLSDSWSGTVLNSDSIHVTGTLEVANVLNCQILATIPNASIQLSRRPPNPPSLDSISAAAVLANDSASKSISVYLNAIQLTRQSLIDLLACENGRGAVCTHDVTLDSLDHLTRDAAARLGLLDQIGSQVLAIVQQYNSGQTSFDAAFLQIKKLNVQVWSINDSAPALIRPMTQEKAVFDSDLVLCGSPTSYSCPAH